METEKKILVHKLMLEVLNPSKNDTVWVQFDGFINLDFNSLMQHFNYLKTLSLGLNDLTLKTSDFIDYLDLLENHYNLIDQYNVENETYVKIKFHNHSTGNQVAVKEYNYLCAIKIDTEKNDSKFI